MSTRKRRSNVLTAEQLDEKRDLRERELNQSVVMVLFGEAELHRSISLRDALQLVRDGDAEKLEADTANGRIVYFRELKPNVSAQYSLPMMPNALSAEIFAGSEVRGRNCRRMTNLIMFPFVGDTRSPLPRPNVSERDCERARSLTGHGKQRSFPDTRVLRNEPIAA